jgi:hypothetical protein
MGLKVTLKRCADVDITVQELSEADTQESYLDVKCGLIRNLTHAETTDELFDIKLALTSYEVRKSEGRTLPEESWLEDFLQRAQFHVS